MSEPLLLHRLRRTDRQYVLRAVLPMLLTLSGAVASAQSVGTPPSPTLDVTPTVAVAQRGLDSLLGAGGRAATPALTSALAAAYERLGEALEKERRTPEALDAYRRAITTAATVHDSSALSKSTYSLGLLHWTSNRYDSALVHLETARDLRIALNDRPGLGRVLNSIGASYYQLGNYEPALDAFVRALGLRREAGDSAGVARILTNIGKTYHDWRQYGRAKAVLSQAVLTARSADVPATLGYALNSLAMLHIDLKEFDRARVLIDSANAAYSAGAPRVSEADSSGGWSLNTAATGLLLVREGRAREALPLLEAVLTAGETRGSVRGQARSHLYLGEAYAALGQRARAKAAFLRSLDFSMQVQQRVLALEALGQLADIEQSDNQTGAALGYLRRFQALRDTIFDQSTAQRIAAMEAKAETEREQVENERLRDKQRTQAAVIGRQQLVGALGAVILLLTATLLGLFVHFNRKGHAREAVLAKANDDLAAVNEALRSASSEVRALKGLIPICSSCKKVRGDQGYWEAVETYISSRSDATFSHSICQSCGPKLYGELWSAESTESD